jgi:hypothetical protein
MTVTDLAPEQDGPDQTPSFAELHETGHTRTEEQIRHRDGYTVDVILETVEIGEGRLVAYVQDISDEKEYKKALERTRDELRQLTSSSGFRRRNPGVGILGFAVYHLCLWLESTGEVIQVD